MDESELVKRCQGGDRQAFEELIRRYYGYVSGFLLKTTADRALAEDLTQETFLKMIRGIEGFDPRGRAAFGTWLISIAKNTCIDALRRNRLRLEEMDARMPADEEGPSDEIERKLRYEGLLDEIRRLPPEQGLAIRMKYVEEMTLAEIAETFGVAPKTIKSRIHEGMGKLRKRLKGRREEDS